MNAEEILKKAKKRLEEDMERAKLPTADRFVLTSLVFCVSKVLEIGSPDWQRAEDALAVLRGVTLMHNSPTHDVFTPDEALGLIDESLQLFEMS